jgi:hypothetical protein
MGHLFEEDQDGFIVGSRLPKKQAQPPAIESTTEAWRAHLLWSFCVGSASVFDTPTEGASNTFFAFATQHWTRA